VKHREGDRRFGIAIEVGGSHAISGLVDQSGVMRATRRSVESALMPTLVALASDIEVLLAAEGRGLSDCAGISLAICGTVDTASGQVLSTPRGKFDDATACDLPAWALSTFGLPLIVANDALQALLGERRAGAARGCDDAVLITLGTGIGGAAIVAGRPLPTKHGQAGTFGGHTPISVDGRPCGCGGHGCAEAEASTVALPAVCADWPGFSTSTLAVAAEPGIDYRTLFRHYDHGDRVAREVLEHSCAVWGTLAVALIHAYDPEVVVVGGGVMQRAEEILPRIREHVAARAWTPGRTARVEQAVLGDKASLYGAIPLLGLGE
jgi:glucokinase